MEHEPASDVEIYIKDTSVEQIIDWLSRELKTVEHKHSKKLVHHYQGAHQANDKTTVFPINIVEHAGDKHFICVWLDTLESPWASDQELAQAALNALDSDCIRYTPAWEEDQDPDAWLELNNSGEQLVIWKDTNNPHIQD